jgi:hypothetical protein
VAFVAQGVTSVASNRASVAQNVTSGIQREVPVAQSDICGSQVGLTRRSLFPQVQKRDTLSERKFLQDFRKTHEKNSAFASLKTKKFVVNLAFSQVSHFCESRNSIWKKIEVVARHR